MKSLFDRGKNKWLKERHELFEQDYIMRLVKEMVRAILKLLFDIDTESPTEELLEEQEEKEILDKLLLLVDNGNINQAENELYELLAEESRTNLKIALLFYSYLNEKNDTFLEEHNFSREEVEEGLRTVVSQYGLSGIEEMF